MNGGRLTAYNQYGSNTSTKTNYIAAGNAPVANFSGTPTSGNAPLWGSHAPGIGERAGPAKHSSRRR